MSDYSPLSPMGQPSSVTPSAPVPPRPLSVNDERTWAMLAHLSVLANLVTGFLGPVAALVIYLVYRDRSRYVAYHSLQSFIFQLIWWGGSGALIGLVWAITGALSAVVIGIVLLPVACLLTPVLYSCRSPRWCMAPSVPSRLPRDRTSNTG